MPSAGASSARIRRSSASPARARAATSVLSTPSMKVAVMRARFSSARSCRTDGVDSGRR